LVGASRFKSSTLAATFAETFLFFKPNVLSAASCAFRSFRSLSFSRFSFSSLRFFSSAVRRFSPSTFFGGMANESRQTRLAPRLVRRARVAHSTIVVRATVRASARARAVVTTLAPRASHSAVAAARRPARSRRVPSND